MNPRSKKTLLLLFKVIVLLLIVEYVRRQIQLDDELAVASSATGAEIALSAPDGRPVRVVPGSRLKVSESPGSAPATAEGPGAYLAVTPTGERVRIALSDVEGPKASFELLPGMRTLLRQLDFSVLGWALVAFGPAIFLMAVRWQTLLVMSEVRIPFWIVVRLHYMGLFFNMFMPGGLGGDVIKAVYVSGHSPRRAEAATMVLIDRVIGLVGLLLMAGTVILLDYRHLGGIALQVGAISLLLTVGSLLFFSARFRALVRYDWVLGKLPKADVLRRIDTVLYDLRRQWRGLAIALALTVVLQVVEVVGVLLAGRALGIYRATLQNYLVFVPLGYLANALPISLGGIGVMEGAFMTLLRDSGLATASQGFMLGVLARLLVIAWSVPGALSALWPPPRTVEDAPDRAQKERRAG